MILIDDAVEELGVANSSVIYAKAGRYHKFINFQKGGNSFDINAYRQMEAKESEIFAKATLFIEYVNKELGISYAVLAGLIGVSIPTIQTHGLSPATALKLLIEVNKTHPRWIESFDDYYNY